MKYISHFFNKYRQNLKIPMLKRNFMLKIGHIHVLLETYPIQNLLKKYYLAIRIWLLFSENDKFSMPVISTIVQIDQ